MALLGATTLGCRRNPGSSGQGAQPSTAVSSVQAFPGQPFTISPVEMTKSLSLTTGDGDLSFVSPKPKHSYFELQYGLTVTAPDMKSHRLRVHTACRYGDLVLGREDIVDELPPKPADPESDWLRLKSLKKGQTVYGKTYPQSSLPELGMASRCEVDFVAVAAGDGAREEEPRGTFCLGEAGIESRACTPDELPRSASKPSFGRPRVEWQAEGVLGWLEVTRNGSDSASREPWFRYRCGGATADRLPLQGHVVTVANTVAYRDLRTGESLLKTFSFPSRGGLRACEIAVGFQSVGADGTQNLLRAKADAVYCLQPNGTEDGPCSEDVWAEDAPDGVRGKPSAEDAAE
ncbi:MAG: hypothetical protein AAGA56_21585 [Myxococcota bacterium]